MRGSGLQGSARLNGAAPERRGGSAMALDVGGIASSVRQELRSGLRGQVICPDDLGYDAARAVFNGILTDARWPWSGRWMPPTWSAAWSSHVDMTSPSQYVGVATASRGTLCVTGQSCLTCRE